MKKFLEGKKTYIIVAAGAIVSIGNVILKIANGEPITTEDIYLILGSLGFGTLRAGIKKAEK